MGDEVTFKNMQMAKPYVTHMSQVKIDIFILIITNKI